MLSIHFMKIIYTGGEKIPEIFAQLFDSSEDDVLHAAVAG